jgi:hypothetical protein
LRQDLPAGVARRRDLEDDARLIRSSSANRTSTSSNGIDRGFFEAVRSHKSWSSPLLGALDWQRTSCQIGLLLERSFRVR